MRNTARDNHPSEQNKRDRRNPRARNRASIVRFYVLNDDAGQVLLGELRLRRGKIVPSNDEVAHMLDEPIHVAGTPRGELIWPSEPEKFLRALPKVYKSPYFTAIPA
jgi:hypothetical protein